MTVHEIEKAIRLFFEKTSHIVSVTLFGSYARKTANKQSDVDVAVLFEQTHIPKTESLLALREELSNVLRKDVDLICLNTVSPIVGMQAYNDGRSILLNDTRKYADYQMSLFSDYAELKELRAPMEKDILKRKFYD